jgi:hypothetical protein
MDKTHKHYPILNFYLDHTDAKSKITMYLTKKKKKKITMSKKNVEEAKDFSRHVNQILTTKQETKRNSQLKHVNFKQPSL